MEGQPKGQSASPERAPKFQWRERIETPPMPEFNMGATFSVANKNVARGSGIIRVGNISNSADGNLFDGPDKKGRIEPRETRPLAVKSAEISGIGGPVLKKDLLRLDEQGVPALTRIEWGQLKYLLEQQATGEDGALSIDGKSNLFILRHANDGQRVLADIRWQNNAWSMVIEDISSPEVLLHASYPYYAGTRLFSNSD